MTSRFYRNHPIDLGSLELIDEDPLNLKHHKAKQEKLSNFYKNRFKSIRYAKQVRDAKYTPQIVLKIVSKGVGPTAVNYLMKYIARELDKFSSVESVELTTSMGEILHNTEDLQEFIREISQDFSSLEYIKSNNTKFDKLEMRRIDLESQKEEAIEFSDRQQIELQEINQEMLCYKMNMKLKELEYKSRKGRLTVKDKESKKNLTKFINANSEKRRSGKEKINSKNIPSDFTHIVLSHGGKDLSPSRAKASVDSFLKSELADRGFEYVYGMHNDTNNPHFHVIVFNKNKLDHRKPPFQLSKEDLFIMRQEFVHHSDAHGIKRVSTLKMDNESVMKRMEKQLDSATDKLTHYQYMLSRGSNAKFNAFDYRNKTLTTLTKLNENLTKNYDIAPPDRKLFIKKNKAKLREVKKELIKVDTLTFDYRLDMVVKSLESDYKGLSNVIQRDLIEPEVKPKIPIKKHQKRKKKYVDDLRAAHIIRVNQALKECELFIKTTNDEKQKQKIKKHIENLQEIKMIGVKKEKKKDLSKGGGMEMSWSW